MVEEDAMMTRGVYFDTRGFSHPPNESMYTIVYHHHLPKQRKKSIKHIDPKKLVVAR